MWLFTNFGFFSVVQKPGDALLTIRARAAVDLDRLRIEYLPTLSPTVTGGGTDYPYRAKTDRKALSQAMQQMVADLNYSNFKSEVAERLGSERAHVYGKVWKDLLALEAEMPKPTVSKPKGKVAYGGVVLDKANRVLLREPLNHYGGYVWTFAKGGPNNGESPEQTALREVLEETGVKAEIIQQIPGDFPGDTSTTIFYLMRLKEDTGKFHNETASVRWVTFDEAPGLIKQTTSLKGRKRDLEVLARAAAMIDHK